MSDPDKRIEARDQFDPAKVAKEALAELATKKRAIDSIRETVEQSKEAVRNSQELISRIPDKW